MLLYLPERIYNVTLKDDETYIEMAKKATEEILVKDYVKAMANYVDENPLLQELKEYIIAKTPEEYMLELNLCFDEDLEKYKDVYEEMDTETKLYWLCEVDDGDMKPTKEFIDRTNEFLRIYENTVKFSPEEYSNFIHMMYYAKITYREIIKHRFDKNVTIEDVKNYIKFEEELFNKMIGDNNDTRYRNMMYSKREQMYVFYYEFVGLRSDNLEKTIELISNHLYQGKFKYNNFTYFRMVFNLLSFINYIDDGNLDNARKYWAKLTSLINYAFQNKGYTIKALNHYNNSFLDEFNNITKFCYLIENTYMSRKYINIDHLMTQQEKRFFRNKLTIQEKKLLDKFIDKNTFYSYEWALAKKEALRLMN